MQKEIQNPPVDILSKTCKIVETTYTDHVEGLLSIGFKLIGICPQNPENLEYVDSNAFHYSLIWDGKIKDGISEHEFRRINDCWPFLSDGEEQNFLRCNGLLEI